MYIFKKIIFFLLFVVFTVGLYIGTAFGFALFPSSVHCEGEASEYMYIYHDKHLLSHTEIILPVEPLKEVYFKAFPKLVGHNAQGYIAFSYGDRDFMMDKDGFDDLNLTLAFRGLFMHTPSLIKVGHYGSFAKQRCEKVAVSRACLARLTQSILKSFAQKKGKYIRYHDTYGYYYVYFYAAKAPYNIFHTCNTWTGNRLREAGLSMPRWTPFAQSVIGYNTIEKTKE